MASNYGLIRRGTGQAVLETIPIPRVPQDYILVKTVAVALNPTDWTTLDAPGENGTLVGCDFAGVVEDVGGAVERPWKKGDRIAGLGHGGNDSNPENGAFARYIAVKGDIQLRIPDHTPFEAAAAMGVCTLSAGYGLYKILGLPYPESNPADLGRTILIYGGSTAAGSSAIQLAKLSGLKVITTCSPKNFGLVKSFGADSAYDYHIQGVGGLIHEETSDNLQLVFDTVNTAETAAICADAISTRGGQYVNLLGTDCPRSDVESSFFLGYDVSGEDFIFEAETYSANPEAAAYATKFMPIAEKLWNEGKLKPLPQRIGPGGFQGVLDGLQVLREGKYSGEKLVYRTEETVWGGHDTSK
ncbi:putative zinc-binding oxidoreductase ToxD [Myriangium duriaei CBS 260.36]|uniref:Zinc-binding oxidoreductase ToxD n=1 Tax=Myriangium duriaei CBS 260.36 TaxID=1168546 RepID=A0A9P4J5I7_9PEZI|nr:putative zinc-binding oxidoreductase ToxD [Myriangium duriaei CBS 260.36]